jgi:hypothetical protein
MTKDLSTTIAVYPDLATARGSPRVVIGSAVR